MNEDRDPRLQAWFAEVAEELTPEPFVSNVMDGWERQRRRAMWIEIAVLLGIVALAIAFFDQVAGAALVIAGIDYPLVEMKDDAINVFVAPVNSIGGLLAVIMLGLRMILRRSSG